jgi:hypothetical protein
MSTHTTPETYYRIRLDWLARLRELLALRADAAEYAVDACTQRFAVSKQAIWLSRREAYEVRARALDHALHQVLQAEEALIEELECELGA